MSAIVSTILSTDYNLPLIVFGILLLSGFNIPFSEDLIIISCALIAKEDISLFWPLYIAIYAGVLLSDHIAFWIGYFMGDKLKKTKWFVKTMSNRRMQIINKYLDTHGILTFIVCRFIPFGVRNTLFMSCGIAKMNYRNFSIYDIIAVSINTTTLYFLIYFLGISVEKPFKIIGTVLFLVLFTTLITVIIRMMLMKKEKKEAKNQEIQE